MVVQVVLVGYVNVVIMQVVTIQRGTGIVNVLLMPLAEEVVEGQLLVIIVHLGARHIQAQVHAERTVMLVMEEEVVVAPVSLQYLVKLLINPCDRSNKCLCPCYS
jgi:hypothetical protein